jgi:hypothetical protein
MFLNPAGLSAVLLLSMRPSASIVATGAFALVAPCVLFLLGIGYIVRWLSGQPANSSDPVWRFFKRALLGLGAVAWLVLTLIGTQPSPGRSNETVAIAELRTIDTAEVTYLYGPAGKYGTIPDLIAAGLLDSRFDGPLSGYTFVVTASDRDYTAIAAPVSTKTGRYGFYSGRDAVVRYAQIATATCNPCYPKGMSGMPVN